MTPETAARLAGCGIQLAAESPGYSMFIRGACVALANPGAAAGIGSTGMMTESGLAFLSLHSETLYSTTKNCRAHPHHSCALFNGHLKISAHTH